jgi:hypothetical protein
MKLQKLAGATSEIWQVFIRDSSSATGAGLAGLVFNSAGLTAYYHRDTDTTATAIALVTMTVGTFTSSGFKEIDATNMPGWYQFCPPNAAIASGAKSAGFHLKGATNMAPLPIEVQLLAVNVDDAVRMGMTSLPNAAAEAAGGLYTRGSGAGQINQDANGRIDVSLKAILGTTLTETAGQIAAGFKKLLDVAAPVFTLTSVNQTGDGFARLGAPAGASASADIAAVKAVLPAALIGGRMDASVGAVAAGAIAAAAFAANALDAVWSTATRLLTAGTNIVLAKGTGVTGFNDLSAAQVNAEADTALADAGVTSVRQAHLDADVSSRSTYAGADTAGTTTLLSRLTSTRAALLDNLDDAISTLLASAAYTAPDNATIAAIKAYLDGLVLTAGKLWVLNENGDALPKTGDIKAAIWSAQVGDYLGAGTTAETLYDGMTAAQAASAVTAKLDATLEDSGGYRFTAHALEQAPTGGAAPTASEIADAVWDEALAGHATDGTAGKAAADTVSMAGTIEGRIGTPNFGDLAGDIAHAQGVIDGIDSKTTNLPSDPADQSLIVAATDAIMGRLGAPSGASVSADIAAIPAAPSTAAIADEVATRTLDANIVKVNGTTVIGTGAGGDEWGPA